MATVSSRIAPVDLRSDARENRDRIVAAAWEALVTKGVDVPMAAIARRAGVGVATLYRHFPTRAALLAETFVDQRSKCATAGDHALADPDPWRAFCRVVEQLCVLQVLDRTLTDAFVRTADGDDLEEQRADAERAVATIVRRAQDAGVLRRDFVPADLTLVYQANGGIRAGTAEETLAASRRLVAYLLQSFRAVPDGPRPLPPAPPLELFDHLMR